MNRTKLKKEVDSLQKKLEEEQMNGRQAAKAAAKRIEELEYVLKMQIRDIKDYNACIVGQIEGESVCKWCEEAPECQRDVKDKGGCSEWWLRYRKEAADASEGVPSTSTEG